ncbi:MAG: dipeptidyl-peptidase-4 [Maribacter sp.]|jgi:dipeptidyl-peptidase-4
MRITYFFLLTLLCFHPLLIAQQKQITVTDIYTGEFQTQGMDVLRSMNNGKQYTVLNKDPYRRMVSVDTYDYSTLEKVSTVISTGNVEGLEDFSSYSFSHDETKLLLATQVESIFRRSTLGVFYVYDIASKKLTKINNAKIQEPTLSPDNKKVAYVKDNNLFLMNLENGTTKQVTEDGVKNKIINGVTDWVYEEEFSFVRAFEWNADGSTIAFLRFDETNVPEFSIDVYGTEKYPSQHVFKYPKAGEDNAIVSLHTYDVGSGETVNIDLGDAYYIPRIKWMNHKESLSVQTMNRYQNHLKFYLVDAKTGSVSLLLEETDKAYVDIHDNLTFLVDDSFIWTSEKDGWNHIYLHNSDGKLMNQITKGTWEVTKYYGYDQNADRIYYQSTENGTINRGVYSVESNGKKRKDLAVAAGVNLASFSANFMYFINNYSSAKTPPRCTLHISSSGKKVKDILDNTGLSQKLEGYETSTKEFSTIAINGNDLNMYMIKPADFDASKKYPLLMYQYSGPGSQNVSNSWMGVNDYWHQILVSKGYIVACVDGRGTGYKGSDFKKATYLNLVKYETEDQISAAKKLSELDYIDEQRTGIWGWSFGGHMSTNCLLKGSDTFEMAIAVAPVTSWRFYDTIYTERFMRTPKENPSGYDDNSPFNYPELLKGDYLLIHGSGDDNVHVQNTMRMVEALVQANKQFEWGIYPDKNHGIYGGNTRIHLYTKMTDFVTSKL